jgi:hypothetical protein
MDYIADILLSVLPGYIKNEPDFPCGNATNLLAEMRPICPDGNTPPPASASAIANAYRSTSKATIEAVKKQWKDEDLQIEQDMWGVPWRIGYSLLMFVKHEVHHRGQLTILMRQITRYRRIRSVQGRVGLLGRG